MKAAANDVQPWRALAQRGRWLSVTLRRRCGFMAVLFVLADPRGFGCRVIPCKMLASEMAILNNFIWNDRWTFCDRLGPVNPVRSSLRRFAKFNLICGFGIVLNVLLLSFFISFLKLDMYLANVVAILIVTIWNFSINYFFNWGTSSRPSLSEEPRSNLVVPSQPARSISVPSPHNPPDKSKHLSQTMRTIRTTPGEDVRIIRLKPDEYSDLKL